MSKPKVLGIVPARKGSKGLPQKNWLDFFGLPLFMHSVGAAQNSKYVDEVVVSTDDPEVINICRDKKVPFLERPSQLAEDNSSMVGVVLHVLENFPQVEMGVLLQPTSPLRTSKHIDRAFEEMNAKRARGLISVTDVELHPLKFFKEDDNGYLKGLIDNELPFKQRQELPTVYKPNGALYIFDVNEFVTSKTFLMNKTIPFYMSPSESVDIDDRESFELAEKFYNQRKENVL